MTSKWTMFLACRNKSPSKICLISRTTSFSSKWSSITMCWNSSPPAALQQWHGIGMQPTDSPCLVPSFQFFRAFSARKLQTYTMISAFSSCCFHVLPFNKGSIQLQELQNCMDKQQGCVEVQVTHCILGSIIYLASKKKKEKRKNISATTWQAGASLHTFLS